MKTRKVYAPYKNEMRECFNLRQEDFSQQGLDLGIWDGLTAGLPLNTDEVEIIIVSRRKAR